MNYYLRKFAYMGICVMHKFKNRSLILEHGSMPSLNAKFEGRNKLSHHAYFSGEIGYASYIGAYSVVIGKIGRYCSIAENVSFITKTHPVQSCVSTHPCFYSLKKQSGFTYAKEQLFDEEPKLPAANCSIEVGNDVYIGYGATVIGPCKIGNGAVIASGAVVTSNIPPYTIVGGIPAKTVKKRFSDDDIAFLEDLQWWNKPEDWIENHAGYFVSIEQLKVAVGKE